MFFTYLHNDPPFGFSCPDVVKSEGTVGANAGEDRGLAKVEPYARYCFGGGWESEIRDRCALRLVPYLNEI